MKNIKLNMTKTFSIVSIVAIAFQSTSYASNKNHLENKFPLKKDLNIFKEFKSYKEPIRNTSKEFNLILHQNKQQFSLNDKLNYPIKILNGRTAIAIKDVTDALDINLVWNKNHRIVEVFGKNNVVRFPIDKNMSSINNKVKPLDVGATISSENSRTYLPLRVLLESLGYKVKFDNNTRTINIYE